MSTAHWPDSADEEDGAPPPFNAVAREWLARQLHKIPSTPKGQQCRKGWDTETLEAVVAWFVEEPMTFVKWEDADLFQGDGYANGGWVVNWGNVDNDLPFAIEDCLATIDLERDAARFPTLDDWLQADMAGVLAYRGADGGSALLTAETRSQLARAKKDRERKRPRLCISCGDRFTPNRVNMRRCEPCRGRGRAQVADSQNRARSEYLKGDRTPKKGSSERKPGPGRSSD